MSIAPTPTAAMIEAGAQAAHRAIYGQTATYDGSEHLACMRRTAESVYIAMANAHVPEAPQ